jgi:tRNA U34 5-carboxymethylaminomethyl modifying GTPase MnmE/TrmE
MENFDNYTNSRIEAVRDLIFGQNLKEYEDKLQAIYNRIGQQNGQIQSEMNSLRAQLLENIASMEGKMLMQIEDVRKATETELNRQNNTHLSKDAVGSILSQIARNI